MKYSIENITKEDIAIATKYNSTYKELVSAYDLVEIIGNDPIMNNKACIALVAYKLGQIQGKREERARRREKQYMNNRKVLEEQRKLLAEIDNLAANRKANNMTKCTELENEFYKLLKALNDKSSNRGIHGKDTN